MEKDEFAKHVEVHKEKVGLTLSPELFLGRLEKLGESESELLLFEQNLLSLSFFSSFAKDAEAAQDFAKVASHAASFAVAAKKQGFKSLIERLRKAVK